MAFNPTIIAANLDTAELEKSIQSIIVSVERGANQMADKFQEGINRMNEAIRGFAQTQQGVIREASNVADSIAQTKGSGRKRSSGGSSMTDEIEEKGYPEGSVGWMQAQIKAEEEKRKMMQLNSQELQNQNNLLAEQKKFMDEALLSDQKRLELMQKQSEQLQRQRTKYLKEQQQPYMQEFTRANTMSVQTLSQMEAKLQRLKQVKDQMGASGLFDEAEINRVQLAIDRVRKQMDALKKKARPASNGSWASIMGMPEGSVNEIAEKMKALRALQINPQNTIEVKQLSEAYQDLKKKRDALLGQNQRIVSGNASLASSNNVLGRSFNYIRNSLVYALTIGTITSFTKQVYEVRGQYQLLERSLGVLVNSFEKGTQIFNELNDMAVKSPFTLIELGTAAKQLTAYNFAADEVVDTTRRLADISAALGVPMERLTYNLGQIKAQGVLNARDARDFANAGLAIVPMLAKLYTEQKRFGDKVVTTAQVYDLMSKKAVTYHDVLRVINKVTDEGGKFFDFQAKQADTLKVKLANLTLAFNNMLNEIGTEQQSVLEAPLNLLKYLFKNWREIANVIGQVVVALTSFKVATMLAHLATSRMAMGRIIVTWRNFKNAIKGSTIAMRSLNTAMAANVIGAVASVIAMIVAQFTLFSDSVEEASQEVTLFGESGAKTIHKINSLKLILNGATQGSRVYKKSLSELKTITDEYGEVLDIEKASRDEINRSLEHTIQLIKEEAAERERANAIAKAGEKKESDRDKAREYLKGRITSKSGYVNEAISSKQKKYAKQHADTLVAIIEQMVDENLNKIVDKDGHIIQEKYLMLIADINKRLQDLGTHLPSLDVVSLGSFIVKLKKANDVEQESIRIADQNKRLADENTEKTMTFTQKVQHNSRALLQNSEDAVQLYNKVKNLVDQYAKTHKIGFKLSFDADNPPKWMMDMPIEELNKLAANFTSIAKSGGHAEGYTQAETLARGWEYAAAARKKHEIAEQNARNRDKKTRKKQSDEILNAIKDEISLVKKLRSEYDKLTSKGEGRLGALTAINKNFGSTITLLNDKLAKFNLPQLDLKIITGKNPQKVVEFFEKLKSVLESKGLSNLERMKAVEGVIQELNVSATEYNLDELNKGLNRELDKLSNEYELALSLQANPEVGSMLVDALGTSIDDLPTDFTQLVDKVNNYLEGVLLEKGKPLEIPFDIMSSDIMGKGASSLKNILGQEDNSKFLEDLLNAQKKFQEMFRKNLDDTEKELDDYVKKYGDYADKIAEIESNRLQRIKELNNTYYTEELRTRPEYLAKLQAIEDGASREMGQAKFDAFKNSRLYVALFDDLESAGTSTLKAIKEKLNGLRTELGALTPEQLKQVVERMNKVDAVLVSRNPFEGLGQKARAYFKALKDGKKHQQAFVLAQKGYDKAQNLLADKEKEYEQLKSKSGGKDTQELATMRLIIASLKENVKKRKEILDTTEQQNEEDKKAKKDAGDVFGATADTLRTMGELASLTKDMAAAFGASEGAQEVIGDIATMFEGMAETGEGIQKIMTGQVFGGIVQVIKGLWDTVSSWFDFSDKKITRQIKKSEKAVKRLELAYKSLERQVEKSLGNAEIRARRLAIENKKLQLAEIERQLALEKSRKKKNRDDDKILDLEGQAQDARNELEDLVRDIANTLLGSDVKSAAEDFVDTWVDAWKQGEDTMQALEDKFDEMIETMIKKSLASSLVNKRIAKIWDVIDEYTSEGSDQGEELSMSEVQAIKAMLGDKSLIGKINEDLKNLYGALGIGFGSGKDTNLSNLQQGIQSITEDTASALEAYMNSVSQQVYYQSDILTQINEKLGGMTFNRDVELATNSQMLLQLQNSYQMQMSIRNILDGWSSPNGQSVRVEMI